ncbi:hypothetical protein [Pedobacter psychroterrae]|uniref:Uncharacterized protein n=1 Tax=Pedobacter psychroterrae TaxID=2530453 RepID=A0A4R0N975_9SPHI|nr:hypothetical protein [Pedobacter psychroterrae]TCC96738.1 hypothetical protein EZ437_21155 [Pedobacter psychroterrae]
MKKLLLLILCTTTLGLVSCKKDTIIQEPLNRTYTFNIQPNQWVLSGDGLSYTYEWDSDGAINGETLDYDGVLVYLSHPINSNSDIQLPYVYNVDAYSYELFDGGIAIDIQSSDNQDVTPIKPARVIRAKVVVIRSE